MPEIALIGFVFFGLFSPGPNVILLTASGARFGFRGALPMVTGVLFGKQFIIWPIGFGVMGVIAGTPWLFTALKS